MIAIINELLDLARIEARRGQDFEIVRTDLAALVHECVHDFRAPEGRDAPALALPAAPVMVALDRGKALQALRNVLSNAYKYSPEGGAVAVTLAVEHGQAVVAVRDHGIGMTPEAVRRVCERFFRADTSGSIPGTGLGMAIVKEIVDLLGGRLAIESAPQQGTTVRIVLPLAAEPAPLAEAVEPAPL
jgi:signal transduction histidine kinase